MNRAFYGILGSKMLTTKDGKYTNAVYGFLAILFKLLEDVNPDYMVVTFDLKAPTERHKRYEGYKANRKGMPEELAEQMPMIKDVLRAMNIDIVEKEGYEGDDILGTLSRYGEKQGLEVTILSGDRDTFQLATDKVTIRIPRTKGGKTETEEFNREKVIETYGIEPKQLIEVKGLQGDSSDNIPGVPGIGEKTALSLIQRYQTIENLYKQLESGQAADIKGKQKENLENNKDLAELSRFLGEINLQVPIEDTLENFKVEEWNKKEVYNLFKQLNFKRYIERFNLAQNSGETEGNENGLGSKADLKSLYEIEECEDINKLVEKIKKEKKVFLGDLGTEQKSSDRENVDNVSDSCAANKLLPQIINQKITEICIYTDKAYYIPVKENTLDGLKEILEDETIEKVSMDFSRKYIIFRQEGIKINNMSFDAKIAAYLLDPTNNKLSFENIVEDQLDININDYVKKPEEKQEQINLFDALDLQQEKTAKEAKEYRKEKLCLETYLLSRLEKEMTKKLEEINGLELFRNIEMPTVEVLSEMQWNGMYANKEELEKFGSKLKEQLEMKTKMIYEMAGEEFNINSTKQLGEILFEKKKLPIIKKTKSGYSTDVDVLEKLKKEDPISEQILEYRQLQKLNSTYVEGLKPYINPITNRIHSFFHQTITATGRISSTEPNLQNIPTRFELGKQVRKIFEPEEGKIYIDADYSQIELRVLAHMSQDKHMMQAFRNNEDIHRQAASKVFKTPIDEVTKEQRSSAKAVNFGIVYGISDFGLGEQLGISRKMAKQYIEEYLEEYAGIKKYMDEVTEIAKNKGYVETLFHRRRYIPELKSKNYNVRQFGMRAAMNTPIQGTAADIMKIAMINVYNRLTKEKLDAKIVLQVHDEMMIEAAIEEAEKVKEILKYEMENAVKLSVPLIAEVSEANNWYDCK